MPSFLIIGAQRGGTSSLYKYLEGHPDLAASSRKETEYFSRRFTEGEAWYRAHFPWDLGFPRRRMAFEATPDYLFYPPTPERVSTRLPDARFVVLLRDPVARAASHFQHMTRLGYERLPFREALARERERIAADQAALERDADHYCRDLLRFSYAARGRYSEQLARWFAVFDPSRFLILRSEDLFADQAATLAAVVAFLGVRSWSPRRFENHSRRAGAPDGARTDRDLEAEALLGATLRDDVRALEEMLGRSMGWDLAGAT
jgi:hypothetical protein